MIGKRDEFWSGFEKQTALKLGWRRAADCSRSGIRQLEMHDHQQWIAVYVGSLAARMTTTGDGDGWKRRHSGCSRKDTVAPGRAGIGRWAQLTWKMHSGDRSQCRSRSIGVTCSCREDRCINVGTAIQKPGKITSSILLSSLEPPVHQGQGHDWESPASFHKTISCAQVYKLWSQTEDTALTVAERKTSHSLSHRTV